MASSFSCLFVVALLLVLVHQHAAAEPDTFDLDKEVERYVERAAKENNMEVVWWDVHGNHDEIKNLRVKGPPVTATAGPVVYGATRSSAKRPNVVYTQWVHNGQPYSSHKFTIERIVEHKKTATWHVDSGFSYSGSVTASASVLSIVNIETKHEISLDLKGGYSEEVSDKETFSLNDVVTVPPMTSVKIDWIITDTVQEVPWTSTVALTGYIQMKVKEKLEDVYTFYYCSLGCLRDSRLKYAGNKTYLYTAKGTFTGVMAHEAHLRATQHGYQASGRRSPVRTYTIPLRMSPHTRAAKTP